MCRYSYQILEKIEVKLLAVNGNLKNELGKCQYPLKMIVIKYCYVILWSIDFCMSVMLKVFYFILTPFMVCNWSNPLMLSDGSSDFAA